MSKRTYFWTDEEVKLLREIPNTEDYMVEARRRGLPFRTAKSVAWKRWKIGAAGGRGEAFSEEEDAILRAYYEDYKARGVAAVLMHEGYERTERSIRSRAKVLGLTSPIPERWSEREDNVLRSLYPHVSVWTVQDDLESKGFTRSADAIHLRAEYLGVEDYMA